MADVVETRPEADDEMEEGEISDDGMEVPGVMERPTKMDIPDLLKEIGGANFNTVDKENLDKISARALRFQTGKAVDFQEISNLYQSLNVSQSDLNSRLEMIHIWGEKDIHLDEVQRLFSEYHPLNVELGSRNTANVVWATAANCARAMLAVSKGIGEANSEKVVKHVLDEGNEKSVLSEMESSEDLVHPEDIGIDIPDGGPWRLAKRSEDEAILLLRFGNKFDVSLQERRTAARSVGLLSRSKREELILEKEKAAQREQEMRKPIDKKNPWGIVAERWAGENRGNVGRDFDDYLDSLDKGLGSTRRDWDAPDDSMSGKRGKGSIKDRLGFGNRATNDSDDDIETYMEAARDDIDWGSKMKRPRMGMVADLVEKKGSAKSRLYGNESAGNEVIKRKVPNRRFKGDDVESENEEEANPSILRRVNLDDRVYKTAGRRLTDRFLGGRLEGRVGTGNSQSEGSGRTLSSKLEARLGRRKSNSEDWEEVEDRGDRSNSIGKDLVIRVTQSNTFKEERKHIDRKNEEMEYDSDVLRSSKDSSSKQKLKERERRDKEKIKALKEREEQLLREKRKLEKRERERKLERRRSRKEYSSDDDSESESDESDSESSSESSESDSDSSASDSDSSSSDSQSDRRKKKQTHKSKKGNDKYGISSRSSKSSKDHSKSDSKKKTHKKDSEEELKKAEELRDKLRNYLKKAKEAKENRKK